MSKLHAAYNKQVYVRYSDDKAFISFPFITFYIHEFIFNFNEALVKFFKFLLILIFLYKLILY